jgi:predicted Zn-dependent protease
MLFPARHLLGAELLAAGKPADAEAVFREDLKRHLSNGWALSGLAQSLAAQNRDADAAAARKQFEKAWSGADVKLPPSGF